MNIYTLLGTCRKCLAETDVDRLEDLWRELDELWMDIKHWIDIVPDIEYGEHPPCLSNEMGRTSRHVA